jgi:EgtB-related family protein
MEETMVSNRIFTDNFIVAANPLLDEILHGLQKQRKSLPSKLFYDERGAILFEQICELEEYYPTRTETAILQQNISDIVDLIGTGSILIEWRWFDQWIALNPFMPMIHINWYEANAYCEWAGRRLPTEAEWELAASASPSADWKNFTDEKRWYPWGNAHPEPEHANLNSITGDIIDVRALFSGDSAFGMRQMIGNVWEWTASPFEPYPGYIIDPYDTYSEPSFGQQKVLRGGCWATRPHVIRNTFRNFYTPDRNNIFAGFRTVVTN